jgi:hypothetical protein
MPADLQLKRDPDGSLEIDPRVRALFSQQVSVMTARTETALENRTEERDLNLSRMTPEDKEAAMAVAGAIIRLCSQE